MTYSSSEPWPSQSLTIRERQVKDLDDDAGDLLLLIPEAKTDAGQREIEIDQPMVAELLRRRAADKEPESYLFVSVSSSSGHREKTWLLKSVRKMCRLAGLPEEVAKKATAHGIRGCFSTRAVGAGVATAVLIDLLGHKDYQTTLSHYALPGATHRRQAREGMAVIQGGRK